MPGDKLHPWDLAAADLTHWLENEPDYYIAALKGGYRSPFSANTSEQQKLEYYRRQVFMQNPDGTPDYSKPNNQGRDMLIKRVGVDGYTQIMSAVMPRRGLPTPVDTDNDPDAEYHENTMQQEQEQEAFT